MSPKPGFAYIWEYHVEPEQEEAFLRLYGPDGEWAQLFRRSDGFIETQLLRDAEDPNRYVTVDYWVSGEVRGEFQEEFREPFESLDSQGEELTRWERSIGDFDLSD